MSKITGLLLILMTLSGLVVNVYAREPVRTILDFYSDCKPLYQVLDSSSGRTVDLLVKPQETKAAVLGLADCLAKEYKKELVFFEIYDSEEAARNRDNPKYPEAKLFKHWLVEIRLDGSEQKPEIEWIGRGRNH